MSNAYDRVLQVETLKALRFPTGTERRPCGHRTLLVRTPNAARVDTERRPCGHRTPPVWTPNAARADTERRRPLELMQNAIGIGFNKPSF